VSTTDDSTLCRTRLPAVHTILRILALGTLLAGCDRCGELWSPFRNSPPATPHACRDDAPRQQ